jgi:hypothetical protein
MYALFPAVTGDVFGAKNGSDFWGHADEREESRRTHIGKIIAGSFCTAYERFLRNSNGRGFGRSY